MTFMHKLSARLARLKDLMLLTVLVATACERPVNLTSPGGDPVTRLVLLPQNLTVHPSDTAQLMAVAFTSAGDTGTINVSWSVTGGTILGTSTSGGRHYGRIKAGAQPGKLDVVAQANAGALALADTAVVAVTLEPVASVTVTPAVVSVLVGTTVQLAAIAKDSAGRALSGRAVTWVSRAPAVATVNGAGLVTGATVGSATIVATSEGHSDSSAVTITSVAVPVASVTVTPASASIEVGGTGQLTATPRDASGSALAGRAITWASSTPSVATVSSSGVVRGVVAGSATITATSEGQNGTSAITVVIVPVASVAVSPASANVPVGATLQLTATPSDSNGNPLSGRTVVWASSASSVATVSASGLVRGVTAGSATITATSEGRSDSAAITVTSVPVASVTVSPAATNIAAGQAIQLTATMRDASGNPLTGRTVTWSSSSPSVAVVYPGGLVTGVALGSATITATSEGQSGSAAVTVTTGPPPVTVNGCPASGYLRLVNVSTASELSSAIGAVQPGDQIRLAAGTYGGFSMSRDGTSSDQIVICSNAVGSAILKGQLTSTASYVMFAGLVFEGPLGSTNQVYLHSCHDVVFTRNEIRFGSYHAGISVDGTHHMTITYNYIHDNGRDPSHDHGIYFKTTEGLGNLIANNLLARNAARGISLHDNNGTGVYDVVVANNTFVYNGSAGLLLNNGDRNIVVNNVFFQNGDVNANSQIRVVGSGAQGILNGNHHQLLNNVTYSTTSGRAGIANENGSPASGNVIANPMLVSPSDWHLRAGSPAIGLGLPGFTAFDYDGRPRASAPAAGAYEFVTP